VVLFATGHKIIKLQLSTIKTQVWPTVWPKVFLPFPSDCIYYKLPEKATLLKANGKGHARSNASVKFLIMCEQKALHFHFPLGTHKLCSWSCSPHMWDILVGFTYSCVCVCGCVGVCVILGLELRALCMLSKCSTTWAMLPILLLLVCFSYRVSYFFPSWTQIKILPLPPPK
jgi:hypothetical protein